jgi:tetratricopeptide (TPR) repeat protein
LRGGDPLWAGIQKAIEDSSAVAVVVSPNSLQAKWVGKELRHALDVQQQRGRKTFPVFVLSLDGTKLGVLEELFGHEPLYIPVSSAAGGVEAAMNPILVAMGQRLPAEVAVPPQPTAEPLEELVLELTDLKFHEQDGVRRPSARARLVYEPSTPGQREVASAQSWRLIAPLGPIEAGELSWYLEHYAIWPSHYFRDRARKVEDNLVQWGRLLHDAALPAAHTANVVNAWSKISDHAGRRFSVYVDAALVAGTPAADAEAVREAATLLLGLPWELLHDGDGYLFQGAKPTRVRRRLPNTRSLDVSVVAAPIRVLLVTARPEDEACGYIDHRGSALPLVEAMEQLGGLVRLHVLSPPTFDALGKELKRAFDARAPYHVVHFDGHGVYDRRVGLGGLCFEDPRDTDKLDRRRHVTVHTDKLGPLLKDYRIPLVFLEACQTAQAEDTAESVASELLQRGVASVVAMSHSVLVETARRFVETFYAGLAHGQRVGDAMLDGQRGLKDDTFRGRIFGAGELRLEDWFVPVLFQEKDDPQLFRSTPAPQTQEDLRTILASRLGGLPEEPKTGFIGRSRELLALQRLLRQHVGESLRDSRPVSERRDHARYAVVRGQGGEGKTALAAEFARWMVRSHQVRRAAFVSVETHGDQRAVIDVVGKQLVNEKFSAAGDLEDAIKEVERALREQSTLLVVDNMESILLPPYLETPEALSEEAGRELKAILALCERLLKVGDTRLVFTSREALPAPFDAPRHRRELHRLDREDAVKLVERALNADSRLSLRESASDRYPSGSKPASEHAASEHAVAEDAVAEHAVAEHAASEHALSRSERRLSDAARESIEALVEAVHGHARTLALLAPELRSRGVEATREALVELMAAMERQFPGSREHSVFASVELSLRRMSAANRDWARVLGVFHGGVDLDALRHMMQWEEADVGALAVELIATGLATPNRYNHLTLNPALCPYLRGRMDAAEREALTARWVEAMRAYAEFLVQQSDQDAEVAATLTVLELPNLFALLDLVHARGRCGGDDRSGHFALPPAAICRQATAAGACGEGARRGGGGDGRRLESRAVRGGADNRIEQQLDSGRLREAFDGAQQLLQRARAAGEQAYPGADYDLAMACFLLARVLNTAGGSEQALPLLDEARQRFEAIVGARRRSPDLVETADRRSPDVANHAATHGDLRSGSGAGSGDPRTAAVNAAEKMVAVCFEKQGGCLRDLGRLDEAATAYGECIHIAEKTGNAREGAVGKGNLGWVRLDQRRYPEALAAHAEARERFTQLDEPGMVAVSWHQTGMVYQNWGQPEAAEDAYRKSLALEVRLGNVAGQAGTLGQLGILYGEVINRPEEAVNFYRQAADKYVEINDAAGEGRQRNNLALLLRRLRRFDEARQEIRRAIECNAQFGHASEPWKTWAILADIEGDDGNPAAAAEAKGKAIACYLAYRRDGGENHDDDGRIASP